MNQTRYKNQNKKKKYFIETDCMEYIKYLIDTYFIINKEEEKIEKAKYKYEIINYCIKIMKNLQTDNNFKKIVNKKQIIEKIITITFKNEKSVSINNENTDNNNEMIKLNEKKKEIKFEGLELISNLIYNNKENKNVLENIEIDNENTLIKLLKLLINFFL
jgi:hypothetical protein